MVRKTIGVFLAGDDTEMQSRIIEGVRNQASKDHINIMVYHSLLNRPYIESKAIISPTVFNGETRIYSLADYSTLDGVVIVNESLLNDKVVNDIVQKAKINNVPIVNIDGDLEECHNILYDDNNGMELLMRHIVEHHGCRKINFISGYPGNRQSEDRIMAYKKVLEENGIPIEEQRIGYGKFGLETKKALDEYFTYNCEIPDCIACANDSMALEAINYMLEKGYHVPSDLLVTGFDGLREGQEFFPALASVRRPIMESGEEAVRILTRLWSSKQVPHNTYMSMSLIENQSCGCKPVEDIDFSRFYATKNVEIKKRDEFNYNLVDMTRDFVSATSIEDLIEIIRKYAYFFRSNMYIALCDDLISSAMNNEKSSGYTEKMIFYTIYGENSLQGERASKEEFPRLLQYQTAEPIALTFHPIYFQNQTIGYIIVENMKVDASICLLYTWINTIGNALGDMCMRKAMETMVETLDNMYVQDPLTGLYNRFGLIRFGNLMLNKAQKENLRVMGIGMDMDRLKMINDTYGHEAGDDALKRIANALKEAAKGEYIISRTGGDEFFVLAICEKSSSGKQFISRFREELDFYNVRSGLSYQLGASCGAVSYKGSDILPLEHIMRAADELMYEDKEKRRKFQKLGIR